MKVTIIGGTGYVGSHIAQEASARDLNVTAIARRVPEISPAPDPIRYITADVTDSTSLPPLITDADVVVMALSPRGQMLGKVFPAVQSVAASASENNARLIVIGGYSALRRHEGGPRIVDSATLPDWLEPEAREMTAIVTWLENSAPSGLEWLYVSPAEFFNAQSGAKPTGLYFVGDDVVRVKDSIISVEDLALGVVDEILRREHSGHISLRA